MTTEKTSTHVLDALLGGLTVFRVLPFAPGSLPTADLFAMLFIAIMFFRSPRYRLGRAQVLIPILILLLGYLIGVSIINEASWIRRTGHITIMVMVAGLIGTGRADLTSMLRGAMLALVLNAVAFYAGLAPDDYGGHLTGYLGDKNLAGLTIGTVGLLSAALARKRLVVPLWLLTAGLVWLTGSRTTLAGLAFATAWVILRPRMTTVVPRLVLGGVFLTLLNTLVEDYSQVGDFADRTGTDALRERIDDAVKIKLQSTPWYGGGLGTATVNLDDHEWFFHNAYDGLRQEGGWILLVCVVGLVIWFGIRPLNHKIDHFSQIMVEANTILFLVCAWKLGEVFFATVAYFTYAAILKIYLESDPDNAIKSTEEHVLDRYRRLPSHAGPKTGSTTPRL